MLERFFGFLLLSSCFGSLSLSAFKPFQTVTTALSGLSSRNRYSTSGSTKALHQSSSDTANLTLDWSFLDAVYLITASPDGSPATSRVDSARKELEKAGLWGKVQVKAFKTDDEDRVRGCYTSHIGLLREIKVGSRRKLIVSAKSASSAILFSIVPTTHITYIS